MTILDAAASQLVIIDIQERLAPAIVNEAAALKAALLLVAAAQRLNVPISVTEQYPKGLGVTVAPLRAALGAHAAIFEKMHFSAMREVEFGLHLAQARRKTLVICGMEAHVCVLQTALDAKAAGYNVALVADAVGSRVEQSREIALQRAAQAGLTLVTAEMVVFEWLQRAGTDDFKAIAPLLK
jgi:nicotinamidase-related amidase